MSRRITSFNKFRVYCNAGEQSVLLQFASFNTRKVSSINSETLNKLEYQSKKFANAKPPFKKFVYFSKKPDNSLCHLIL